MIIERFIPENATLVDAAGTDAAVYVYEKNGDPCAIGYHGKAQRSDFFCRFRSVEDREKYIARFIQGRQARAEAMADLRAKRNQPHTLTVGQILVSSWGYDQTNVDFYQVTRVVGVRTVEVREIASEIVNGASMTGTCTPKPDAFTSAPMVRRANSYNSVKVRSCASASPWDGRPRYWSSYA
jgi:hypothetical protein